MDESSTPLTDVDSIIIDDTATVVELHSSDVQQGYGHRLQKGDLILFDVAIPLRTNVPRAVEVELIESAEQRRQREREALLIKEAEFEEGAVKTLKEDFGFLRPVNRHGLIFFRYTDIILPEDNDAKEFRLCEGQDVKFKVIRDGSNGKECAKLITFLPRGTVIFESVERESVEGRLER